MAIATSNTTGGASALPAAGGTSESTISNYAGPYVTNMLGQAQAIANSPYQTYQGPMTAGESNLQSQVFQGLGSLNFPQNLGQSFSSSGAYAPPQMNQQQLLGVGGNQQPNGLDYSPQYSDGLGMLPPGSNQGIASNYMNPYLQSVLQPQLAELRRQSQINLQPSLAKMTQAGGYGGGRQAIMESEANRNLLQAQNQAVGQGYASAYDKGMQQFNTEQGQSKDLVNMMANAGGAQRGINQEGITADYNEFLAQRDYPMKQTQYLQSMLQGLPIQTVTNSPLPMSGIGQLASTVGNLSNLNDALAKFKLI
jgi:hypothetical protein